MTRFLCFFFILLFLPYFAISAAVPDNFTIIEMNTPTLLVNKKTLKVGDRFKSNATIQWGPAYQAVEAQDDAGQLYIFTKEAFDNKKAHSAREYLLSGQFSTRSEFPSCLVGKNKTAFPEKRIALLIGNSNYESRGDFLIAPINDVSRMSSILVELGFDTYILYDVDKNLQFLSLSTFAEKAQEYDIALFYYAGHGFSNMRENYIRPIDVAEINSVSIHSCLRVSELILELSHSANKGAIMVLDACRSLSDIRGEEDFAPIEAPEGLAIFCSASTGKKAIDVIGEYSPFAQAFSKQISARGQSIVTIGDNVRTAVRKMTSKYQSPTFSDNLDEKFYFLPNNVSSERSKNDYQSYQIGMDCYNNKEYQEALPLLVSCVQNSANDPCLEIGICNYSLKNYSEAVKWYKRSIKQGNVTAADKLGLCFANGEGVEKDYEEAVKWYKMAADQGVASAQNHLGVCYKKGYGVDKNYTEAAKWYKKAAEQGYAQAQNNLGNCYYHGNGVPKDFIEAVKWYKKAADQGYAQAQSNLGYIYSNGEGVEKDYEEAIRWYKKASEQGHAQAQCNIGLIYAKGEGVEKDYSKAVKWYKKAAEQGNAQAQNYLGVCYAKGNGVGKDDTEAVKWYKKAAEQGHAQAQNNLGLCYAKGKGVEKDYTEAAKWYKKAADQGYAQAQNYLGVCYANGNGVEKDYSEAVKWYKRAAEQGYAKAQCNLGNCHYYGKSVEQDYSEAIKWFEKSAEQGDSTAQFYLGRCYELGHGVTADETEAIKWYRKSAEAGNKKAKEKLAK